ncbi:hypothetical protein BLSTO_01761 [Blastocystis sp. subtype 1]
MSFLAGFTGCCIGLCTKLYSNALQPWEHVLYMVVGGTTFYYGKKFIDSEKSSLRKMLVDLDRENIYGKEELKKD